MARLIRIHAGRSTLQSDARAASTSADPHHPPITVLRTDGCHLSSLWRDQDGNHDHARLEWEGAIPTIGGTPNASTHRRKGPSPRQRPALDNLFGGPYPDYRAVHAKGAPLSGAVGPTPESESLTRAPHATRSSTPVSMRFSDSAGVPAVPDNDPQGASPRGCAVAFIWLSTCTPISSATPPTISRRAQRQNFLSSSAPFRQAAHPCLTQRRWKYSSADILPHWPSCKCGRPFPTSFAKEHFSLSTSSNSRMPTDLSATAATAPSGNWYRIPRS
jgi:hypothetical protein